METKNLSVLIKNRRATPPRFMAKSELEKAQIEQILENANWAPNHKNTEPWRFKVYMGESKKKLAEDVYGFLSQKQKEGLSINPEKIEKLKTNIERVPVVIITILQRDIARRLPEWEEMAAVSMAVQNMWLTATELGLGAFWATPPFAELLKTVIPLSNEQKILGFFYLGEIALDYPSPGRGNINTKVEWM